MQTVLEVNHLRCSFTSRKQSVTVVDDVSFLLGQKETLGIVGESGCGKSVTSLSIMRLLPRKFAHLSPESSIKLDGRELTSLSDRGMCDIRGSEISMIFQDSIAALNPVMTIGKQLTEVLITRQKMGKTEAWEKACHMLEKVGISSPKSRMKEYPHQLSGGMRQRVMIAMALSCNPRVLIADEPTTALDVTIQAQILDMMKELKQTMNTSILLITHDMGVVAEMADRILVMYAGKVVECSDTKMLFQKPLHPYTKGLLQSIPRLDKEEERLFTITGMVPNPGEMPLGCRFYDRCDQRMERCQNEPPALYPVGERFVRCFLHEGGEGK